MPRANPCVFRYPNCKNAPRGPTWGVVPGLFLQRKQPAVGLHKPRVFAFALDVAKYRSVQRRVRRLTARARPVLFSCHLLDQLLGGQRLFGFGENFSGGVDGAECLIDGNGR